MVAEYIGGIKVAWDVAKALKVATDSIDDAQIKLQMAELISALADAKIEAAENSEKIKELEKKLTTKSEFMFDGSKYFRTIDSEKNEGPFCPTCYDNDMKEIRLQHIAGSNIMNWTCRVCRGHFQ